MTSGPAQMHVGYPDEFQKYIGHFRDFGKSMNARDYNNAYLYWNGMPWDQRMKAEEHIRALIVEMRKKRSGPAFLPFPVNHLRSEAWTRIATPVVKSVDEEYEDAGYYPIVRKELK